jgi:hypothetical protein
MEYTLPAQWVINYLSAIEVGGKHAPVETMRQVAESQLELISALEICMFEMNAAGYRHSSAVNDIVNSAIIKAKGE